MSCYESVPVVLEGDSRKFQCKVLIETSNKFPLGALTPKRPRQGLDMGISEPGGEKERELARMATMVIAAGRREGRQANDWRTFNEKTIKQAKTGLFIQNLCETEHPRDYERGEIFILESRRNLGRLYEMAPVRIEEKNDIRVNCHSFSGATCLKVR